MGTTLHTLKGPRGATRNRKRIGRGPGSGTGEQSGKGVKGQKARAKRVGAAIAKQCLEKGIDKVVFDRAGYKYHGRVSALADGAREAGLKF